MYLLYAQLGLLLAGAFLALGFGGNRALRLAGACSAIACGAGFCLSLSVLREGVTLASGMGLASMFSLPLGTFSLVLDPLAAFFLLPVQGIGALAGALLFSGQHGGVLDNPSGSHAAGRHGFFFCMLLLSLILVMTASDAFLFLLLWEIMSLCPLFLLSPRDRNTRERFSAWVYVVVAHLGALPLFLLFGLMMAHTGHSTFFALQAGGDLPMPGLLFILALVGFGAKAGLFPLHVWMPEAYPTAPSHAAMVMSGAMANAGIYGILRVMALTGTSAEWWGYVLMIAGGLSGLMGIMFTLVQTSIQRTLAYSSSENMGIVCLGFGACLVALHHDNGIAAALFSGGALLHLWNHSLFKSLLMLGAGTIEDSTGTDTVSNLGGLFKKMPLLSSSMGAGCAAIAGVPPFNGFMSELLLFAGFAFGAMNMPGTDAALVYWIGLFTLGGISGLSLFTFTRMYGLAFLGAPRSSAVDAVDRPAAGAVWLCSGLALTCLAAALASPWLYGLLAPVQMGLFLRTGMAVQSVVPALTLPGTILAYAALGSAILCAMAVFLILYKRGKTSGARSGLTWDCGYLAPTSRMQYTPGSYSRTGVAMLSPFIRPSLGVPSIKGLFPRPASARWDAPDWAMSLWTTALFRSFASLAEKSKGFQHGLLNSYILYILLALVIALVWALEYA